MDNCSILDLNDIGRIRGGVSIGVGSSLLIFIFFTVVKLLCHQCKQVRKQTKKCCTCYTFHTFFCNPFLCLAVSCMLSSFSFSFNFGSISEEFYCHNLGYFIQALESFQNWMTLFFAFYFVFYVSCKGKPLTDDHVDEEALSSHKCCYCLHAATVGFFMLLLVVLSIVYNLPDVLKMDGGSYGKSGPWCWIQGKEAQLHFWYLIYWIFQGLVFICFIVAIATLLFGGCKCCNRQVRWKKTRKNCTLALGLVAALLVYYFVHIIFVIIESVVRLDKGNDCSEVTKELWKAYAVSTPLSKLFLVGAALVFVVVQFTRPKLLIERVPKYEVLKAGYDMV